MDYFGNHPREEKFPVMGRVIEFENVILMGQHLSKVNVQINFTFNVIFNKIPHRHFITTVS